MSQIVADLLLLMVTLVWGSTFVVVKNAISSIDPMTFIAVRFFIGGSTLLFWYGGKRFWAKKGAATTKSLDHGAFRQVRNANRTGTTVPFKRFLAGACVTGFALFFAYATQTIGLLTVPAGKAAFITGLSVVLVPLASHLVLKTAPESFAVCGVILATIGLSFMSLRLPFEIAFGDFLVFLCAIGFAAHILLVGALSKGSDPVLFAGIQLMVVSAGSFLVALLLERPLMVPQETWGALVFTALFATSFAFLTQSAVQKYTSSTHTALIFSAEPVFGAIFAWLLAGEVLSTKEFFGAACILGGMLISEIGPVIKNRQQRKKADDASRKTAERSARFN